MTDPVADRLQFEQAEQRDLIARLTERVVELEKKIEESVNANTSR